MNISFKKSGLILSEALLTVAILGLSVLTIGSMITTAMSTTTLSKNYLLAQNLAIEGVEAVKKIRDTNRLLAPDNPACWLRKNTETECPDLVEENKDYIVVMDVGGKWSLGEPEGALNLSDGPDPNFEVTIADTGTDFYRNVRFDKLLPPSVSVTVIVKIEWMEGRKIRIFERSVTFYNNI